MHAVRVAALPALHRSPFDRLLIAQAVVEDLALVSTDVNMLAYAVRTIDARQ